MFEDAGYEIKVFNLCDMPHSNCYNPFEYLRGEEDVLTLISCLIKNTEEKERAGIRSGKKQRQRFYRRSSFT